MSLYIIIKKFSKWLIIINPLSKNIIRLIKILMKNYK